MNPKAMQPAPIDPSVTPQWAAWYEAVFKAAQPVGGTTAQRPTAPVLYQQYFDTTLGKPIWCSQVTSSVVWKDATGATV
jgi:hypothetical protein